jgi:hypothetical protein
MLMQTIDISVALACNLSQPKFLEGNNTSSMPMPSPTPVKGVYISKKKRYKLAAALAAACGALPAPPQTKANANNSRIKQLTFRQEDALRDIGITSLGLIDREQFSLIDPTLGDWGCQLRVLWLVDLANKYRGLRATHPSELTPDKLRGDNPAIPAKELEMLGMYRMGTLFTSSDIDGLGMRKSIRTGPRNTTPEENAAGWKFGSQSQNKAVFNYTKATLGDAVNESLIEALRNSHVPDREEYLAAFTRNDISRRIVGDQGVSVVGFYGGCKAVLDLAAERNFPLIVTLKKFVRDTDDNVRLEGVEVATFSAVAAMDGSRRVYMRDENARRDDELGMAIHAFSCFSASGTDEDAGAFFANARRLVFDEFDASYDGLVAAHPQYPPLTHIHGHDGEFLTDETGKPLELLHELQGVAFDATPTLRAMRERATGFALTTGVGQGRYYTPAIGPDEKPAGTYFERSIPMQIEHIHVASSNGAALEMHAYAKKYGQVIIPAGAVVSATTFAGASSKPETFS